MAEWYMAMDVFVFPSIYEGFPLSVVEAQAAGLRCVVSAQIPTAVVRTEQCIPLPLSQPEKWAETALDTGLIRSDVLDLCEYDMNREIRRLEKLYLDRMVP